MTLTTKELDVTAYKIRRDILTEIFNAKSGHPGGSLSIAEIMSVLYFKEMNISPENPKDPDRDRFVLSKGHCAPALYAALAHRGFFPTGELPNLRKIDSFLQGHPDMRKVPGVDMSTGSLGQGVCAANGMALAAKIDGKNYRVYTVLGDGELEEGQVWEAAMFAAHYGLGNLTAFIDLNLLQIDGDVRKVMNPTPVDKKFEAFGWHVLTINGQNVDEIINALAEARKEESRPTAIICNNVKGKGVSFMENEASWHGNAPNEEQYNLAIAEIDAKIKESEEK